MSLWDNFLKDISEEFKNKEHFLKGSTISRCIHPKIDSINAIKYLDAVSRLEFLKARSANWKPNAFYRQI